MGGVVRGDAADVHRGRRRPARSAAPSRWPCRAGATDHRYRAAEAPQCSARPASRHGIGQTRHVFSYLVSVSKVIAADPQRLFDVVADPAMHPLIDGSGSVQGQRAGAPERLCLGATFGMDMKIGAHYPITNTVVEFEEGRRIAWRHFNGHVWRYAFEPVAEGTKVTEQWDARPAKNRLLLASPASHAATGPGCSPPSTGSRRLRTSVSPNSASGQRSPVSSERRPRDRRPVRRTAAGAGRRRAARPPAAGCAAPRAQSAAAAAASPSWPSRSARSRASTSWQLRRERLAGPLPQHGAQLVLDVEADPVVDAVDVAAGDRQQVAALAVGVVDHRVEHRDPAQRAVVRAS